jgi:hypothetical protein
MASWSLDAVDLPDVELSGSEEEDELDIDEEGYYNEDDRSKLQAMNELQREQILYERKQKQKEKRDRQSALSRYTKSNANKTAANAANAKKAKDTNKRARKSSVTSSSSGKEAALASIRKRKMKGTTLKRSEELDTDSEFEDEDLDEPTTKKPVSSISSASKKKDKIDDSDQEDRDQDTEHEKPKRSVKTPSQTRTPLTLQTLSSIQIRRRKLEKIHFEGWFDQFVTGLFVRLFAGKSKNSGTALYFVAEIVGVEDYHKKYQFGQLFTKRALLLRHPTFEDKLWKMTDISDSDFTQEEMNVWLSNMKKAGLEVPSAEEAAQRAIDAQAYRKTYKHTPEEIARLIQQRKEVEDNPANLTREIIEMDLRIQKLAKVGDEEEAKKLSYKLDALKEQEELLRRRSENHGRHLMTGLRGGPKVSGPGGKANSASSPSRPSGEDSLFSPDSVVGYVVRDDELPGSFVLSFHNSHVPKELKILAKLHNVDVDVNLDQNAPSRKRKHVTAFGNKFYIYPQQNPPKELVRSLPAGSLSMSDYIARVGQAQPQRKAR